MATPLRIPYIVRCVCLLQLVALLTPGAGLCSDAAVPPVLVRSYSNDAAGLTIGMATLHAEVPGVAVNK